MAKETDTRREGREKRHVMYVQKERNGEEMKWNENRDVHQKNTSTKDMNAYKIHPSFVEKTLALRGIT